MVVLCGRFPILTAECVGQGGRKHLPTILESPVKPDRLARKMRSPMIPAKLLLVVLVMVSRPLKICWTRILTGFLITLLAVGLSGARFDRQIALLMWMVREQALTVVGVWLARTTRSVTGMFLEVTEC